jgi:hypothetical protein
MRKVTAVMVVLLLAAVGSFAQSSSTKQAVSYYDAELFKVGYNLFGGLNVGYQGQSSSILFGVPETYRLAFSKYPDTKLLLDSYSSLDLAGNILIWGGLAATLVGAYLPLASVSSTSGYNYSSYQTAIWIAVGGLIAELIGAFVLPASFERLINAVNTYNRHRMEEYPG